MNNEEKSKISVFCHGIVEAFAFLGCYVEQIGSCLPTFWDSLSVPSSKGQTFQEECTMQDFRLPPYSS